MRNRSPANKAASSPPVPARTSRMALPSSAASFGRSAMRIACDMASESVWAAASSSVAIARISESSDGSLSIASRSARSLSFARQARIAVTTGSSSFSSRDSAEYSAPATPSVRRAPISSCRRRMRSRLSLAAILESSREGERAEKRGRRPLKPAAVFRNRPSRGRPLYHPSHRPPPALRSYGMHGPLDVR